MYVAVCFYRLTNAHWFWDKSHIRWSGVSLTSFKYCSFVCYAFDMTLPQDVAKFLYRICCMSWCLWIPQKFCSFIVVSLKEIIIAARKDSIGNIVEKLLLNFNMGGKIVNELMITRGQRRLYQPNYRCYEYTFTYCKNFPSMIYCIYVWLKFFLLHNDKCLLAE